MSILSFLVFSSQFNLNNTDGETTGEIEHRMSTEFQMSGHLPDLEAEAQIPWLPALVQNIYMCVCPNTHCVIRYYTCGYISL